MIGAESEYLKGVPKLIRAYPHKKEVDYERIV